MLEKSSVVELTLSDRRESKGLGFNSPQLAAQKLCGINLRYPVACCGIVDFTPSLCLLKSDFDVFPHICYTFFNMKKIRFFTSIEFVVVLAIISLLLGLTTVYYFNFKTATALKLSAYEVAAVLNQARSLAITNQDKYSVVFDLANNKYEIQDVSANRIDEEHCLTEGIVFDSVSFIGSNVEIFSSTGTAIAGTVKLKDNKAQTYSINVNGATGRVKVSNN